MSGHYREGGLSLGVAFKRGSTVPPREAPNTLLPVSTSLTAGHSHLEDERLTSKIES